MKKKNTTSDKRVRTKQDSKVSAVVAKQSSVVTKQPLSKKRSVVEQQPSVEPPKKKVEKAIDHSEDPIFGKAVESFNSMSAEQRLGMEKTNYARSQGVDESDISSFLHYVHDDPEKRRILGNPPGRPSKVDNEITDELIQYVISYNRANEKELSKAKIIKKLKELDESITTSAAQNYVYRTLKKKINEQKPTQPEEGFRFIPLPKGTSNRLQRN